MTICKLINRIEHNIIAWHMMLSPSQSLMMIQPDRAAIDEASTECWRAIYDTIREFQDECVKRGRQEAAKRIASFVTTPGNQYSTSEEIMSLIENR